MNPHPRSLRFRRSCSSSRPVCLLCILRLSPQRPCYGNRPHFHLLPLLQVQYISAFSPPSPTSSTPHLYRGCAWNVLFATFYLEIHFPSLLLSFLPSFFHFFLSSITSEVSEPTLPPASIPWDYYITEISCLGGSRGSVSLYPQCLLDAWLLGHAWHMLNE